MFLQNRNCSKEIPTIIVILFGFRHAYIERSLFHNDISSHPFFYDSVIISQEHLKKSTCQRNCVYFTTLFATIHYYKRSMVDSRKSCRICLFQENHCGHALLKVPIYSTELVAKVLHLMHKSTYRDVILSW